VRQGCPLSPILFNLAIADLKEYVKRKGWNKIGREKTYTLMYADTLMYLEF